MDRVIGRSLIALCVAAVCVAQEAPPARTEVVLLDMVVRDKQGQPVLDLRQDEIQLSDDGKRVEISSVQLVQAGNTAPSARPRLVVLAFEPLSQESAHHAREAATELASKSFPPDTWFAVVKIGQGGRLLQTFTSNLADLHQAIATATGAAGATPPLVRAPLGNAQAGFRGLDRARQGLAAVFDQRLQAPGHLYLVPLRGIVQSLEPVPGRKAVVYFSQGLRLSTRKTWDALASDGNRASYSADRQTLEALVSDANRVNVTIYSLDLMGLTGLSSTGSSRDIPPPSTVPLDLSATASSSYDPFPSRGYGGGGLRTGRNPSDQGNLKSLAEDTGGILIARGKHLSQGLDLVAADLANYYEVTYVPQRATADGRFRRIEAKVLRGGASLRTRRGYSRSPSTSLAPCAAADLAPRPEPEGLATDADPIPASATPLATILERAGKYVSDYEQTFKNLLAEEEYDQRGMTHGRGGRRSLHSDLVFVSTPGTIPWTSFRDVYAVDGKKVREREARLEKLFLQGTPSAVAKAEAIRKESSRYNIGSATRNVNVPTLALLFLDPRNQARFRFERKGERWFSGTPGAEVAFTEVVEPSLVSDGHDDLPGEGRFWIDANRGTVLRSEVTYRFKPNRAYARVAVEYRPEPGLSIWVPAEMKEQYGDVPCAWAPVFGSTTEGTARYSNYRRFQVSTEEKAEVREP